MPTTPTEAGIGGEDNSKTMYMAIGVVVLVGGYLLMKKK